jgi:transcriptional regulator with XRE-family HTH domain
MFNRPIVKPKGEFWMPTDREALGRALRHARDNRGLSQAAAAKRLRLSRTVLAQIELGNRPVSDDELSRLSSLYETSVAGLTGASIPSDDFGISVFEFAPELLSDEETKARVLDAIGLLRLAFDLDVTLGLTSYPLPRYMLPSPSSVPEAVRQGERAAEEERRRVGLGALPLGNAADLTLSQRIRVLAIDLPDGFSGMFVRHESGRTAILINSRLGRAWSQYAILQSYAHAVFEGDAVIRATKRSNAGELRSKRANAFVTALLLPETGVRDFIESIGKGYPSRKVYSVFDETDEPVRAERRSSPGSQFITFLDVAEIAARFGAPYGATVARLLSLGMISESENRALLSPKRRKAAEQVAAVVPDGDPDGAMDPSRRSFRLKREILHFAIECYRRGLIEKERLVEIGQRLQLPELSTTRLLELAQAAR